MRMFHTFANNTYSHPFKYYFLKYYFMKNILITLGKTSLILSLLTASILFPKNVLSQNCSVNSGIPQTICANQQLFLDGSYTPPLHSGAQVVWSQIAGPAATIVNPTLLTTEVTNLIPGNAYTFRITTTCADGALTYQDVTDTVKSITIATAGRDTTYCPGATAFLSGNTPGSGETGEWSGGGNGIAIVNPSSPTSQIIITGNGSGSTTLRWTITNSNGCSSYAEVVITNRGGILPVTAGINQTLGHCYYIHPIHKFEWFLCRNRY